MELALLIIGIVLGVLCIGLLIVNIRKFAKSLPLGGNVPKIDGKTRIIFISLVALQGITTILSTIGLILFNHWTLDAGEWVLSMFGSYFLGLSFDLFFASFGLFFYRKDLFEKQRRIAKYCLWASIPLFIVALWLFTDGIARSLTYPLANSISFTNGFGFPNKTETGFSIAFYGIVIVFGAVCSYFIGDHHVYAKYGKHGLLDTLFLVAFPMGLVGARLWWCVILEPGQIFYGDFVSSMGRLFNIREGGLAIQGGALFGIVFGVLFVIIFRKYMNLRWLVDVCVPTILIAQAIGRWGNFFNQEVFGVASNPDMWFLPKIIKNNMFIYSSVDGETNFRVPLFLIESAINMAGYFIIRYAIGRGLKKFLVQGDQGFIYIIWYGLVRVALEPLREGFTLNLGSSEAFGYLQSWIVAFAMVAIGILGMVGLRVFEIMRRKVGKEVKKYEAI